MHIVLESSNRTGLVFRFTVGFLSFGFSDPLHNIISPFSLNLPHIHIHIYLITHIHVQSTPPPSHVNLHSSKSHIFWPPKSNRNPKVLVRNSIILTNFLINWDRTNIFWRFIHTMELSYVKSHSSKYLIFQPHKSNRNHRVLVKNSILGQYFRDSNKLMFILLTNLLTNWIVQTSIFKHVKEDINTSSYYAGTITCQLA